MIYTVTLNPSLDYIMHVDSFQEGETNRSSKEEMYAGGKGFNVSTILARLGIPSIALGFVAGFTGDEIMNKLTDRGFELNLITLAEGTTRINMKMKGVSETEINGSGPIVHADELETLYDQIQEIQDGDTLVLAGSIPSSLPKDIYLTIMKHLQHKDVRIIVDATNQALLKVLPLHPFLIKPNRRELEEIFSTTINNDHTLVYYATKLQKMGAQNVIISLGGDGALLITDDNQIIKANVAKGNLINSVGSGDSMIAGFIAGYDQNHNYEDGLRLGSACGSATAFSNDLAESTLIEDVLKQIRTKQIYW